MTFSIVERAMCEENKKDDSRIGNLFSLEGGGGSANFDEKIQAL